MDALLQPRPRTSEMTFWSRYDPVSQPKANTDHWTKMKQRIGQKAVQFRSLDNPDSIGAPITLAYGGGGTPTNVTMTTASDSPATVSAPDRNITRVPYGRVSQLKDMMFDDFVVDALQGAIPGSYMYTRPRNSVSRDSTRNSFNERARDGFRYWLIQRPPPTNFGKYGIGSYKTVLGIGNAPRT